MASFPTTPVIDGFNRANEDPIASGWSGPIFNPGIQQLRVVSNQVACQAAGFGGSWWTQQYGPDMEAYATIGALGDGAGQFCYLYCRAQSVGTTSLDGYIASAFSNAPGSYDLQLLREDNGSDTDIGLVHLSSTMNPWTVGDKFGLRVRGSTIELWINQAAGGGGPYGAGWTLGVSVVDTTYSGNGYVGLAMDVGALRLDDVGGGTMGNTYLYWTRAKARRGRRFTTLAK